VRSWQRRARRRLVAALGRQPEAVPPNLEVIETAECDGYTRQRVVYDSEAHMSVPAFMLVPTGRTDRGSAVLAVHGHGPGKDEICALVPGDEGQSDNDYAHRLVQEGYVVLAPDLRGFGERAEWAPPNLYHCDLTHTQASMLGYDLLTLDLWDLARGLDVLAAHPLVDRRRIGACGLSFGGTCTLFLAAWDRRVRAAVVSGYFNAWADCATVPWNMCGSQVLRDMVRAFDHVELGALVAPRPLLVESGDQDLIFPQAAARREAERLASVYAALGVSKRFSIDAFSGPHRWHGAEAYAFFERWLGRGRRRR